MVFDNNMLFDLIIKIIVYESSLEMQYLSDRIYEYDIVLVNFKVKKKIIWIYLINIINKFIY